MRSVAIAFFVVLMALLGSRAASAGDLRSLTTNHYVIHTDLDRALAEDLAHRMDAMYEDYTRRLADFNPESRVKFEVYLFAKRIDYMKFTQNRVPNTGGVFMPSRNALAAFLEGQGRDALRRTLQHEAFHQFAYSAISRDLPPWINEGLATVFEEGIFMGRTFALGEIPPRRVRQLQADIKGKKLIPFKRMMDMSLDDWSVALRGEGLSGATQYTQAWAMCHFLIFANHQGEPTYRKRFLDLLARIHANVEPNEAFRQAFSDNLDGFYQRFLEFAKNVMPTPQAAMLERQDILADMLVALNEKGKHFDTIKEFRDALAAGGYRMNYQRGDIKWNSDPDPRSYFKNLDGTQLNNEEIFFDTRSGSPLPDLVIRAPRQIKLRTIFYDLPGQRIEHEVVVTDPPR